MSERPPTVHVLGTAQDGGFPHAGCDCFSCEAARKDRSLRRRVASIGIVGATGQCLIVDATPDFPAQMSLLGEAAGREGPSIDAVLLTHAHIGHYLGLAFLGREVINADRVPVYCTRSMEQFLRTNRPWAHLVERNDVEIRSIRPGEPLNFDGVEIEAFLTPHRAEDTDTIMLDVRGPEKRLVYISDTDFFHDGLVSRACEADVALLDGTFYSHDEIKHREILEVKHPAVKESFPLFEGAKGTIYFTHLNHTNALLHPTRAPDLPDGFALANDGMSFTL
ncbi:MAG: MBL fold metallo-hydrolase [Planctomycetota bacterium]|nr:MBL fold metallo-hydrolase [Planctomycetota bacterium]